MTTFLFSKARYGTSEVYLFLSSETDFVISFFLPPDRESQAGFQGNCKGEDRSR